MSFSPAQLRALAHRAREALLPPGPVWLERDDVHLLAEAAELLADRIERSVGN